MSSLESITSGKDKKPRRVMVYGTQGIGKSSFAAMSPDPIFIQTEDGLNDIDCSKFPLSKTFSEVQGHLVSLYNGEHDFKTIVIDSLDWLEGMIYDEVCERSGKFENIEDFGYGKGYVLAIDVWREILDGLSALRDHRGMDVILLAHSKIENFNSPDSEPYDRYSPRLDKRASPLIMEWCDEVLFACYKVHTKQVDAGFNNKKSQGIGSGERVLKTVERPSSLAKNRLNLPDELPLLWAAYAEYLK